LDRQLSTAQERRAGFKIKYQRDRQAKQEMNKHADLEELQIFIQKANQ